VLRFIADFQNAPRQNNLLMYPNLFIPWLSPNTYDGLSGWGQYYKKDEVIKVDIATKQQNFCTNPVIKSTPGPIRRHRSRLCLLPRDQEPGG
jgi:hypothetical protein